MLDGTATPMDVSEETLRAAYSADTIMANDKIRKPFTHQSRQYTVVGIISSRRQGLIEADILEVVAASQYVGPTHSYSERSYGEQSIYEGMRVKWEKRDYVLRNKQSIKPAKSRKIDRAIAGHYGHESLPLPFFEEKK